MAPPQLGKDADVKWTPTEHRILAVLADGETHSRKELFDSLRDAYGEYRTLHSHLINIRRKLHADYLIVTIPSEGGNGNGNGQRGRKPSAYRLISISASLVDPRVRDYLIKSNPTH